MADSYSHPLFSCRSCRNPIALREDLLSKRFVAKSGGAFLFKHAMNVDVVVGKKEDRQLMTGYFSVADIFCSKCGEELGWKYVKAYDPSQIEGFKFERLEILPKVIIFKKSWII